MPLNLSDIILLLGAAQGFLLGFLLMQKYRRLYANRFLAAEMLFYSIIILDLMFNEIGVYKSIPHVMLLPAGFAFIITPLHFLYTRFLVSRSAKFTKTDWLHFLPVILYKIYIIPDFFKPGDVLYDATIKADLKELPLQFQIFNWIVVVQGIVYLALSILLIRRYSRQIKNVFSSLEKVKLGWLQTITYLALCVVIVFGIENAFLLAGINLSNFFNLSSILGAVNVYVMGYLGLYRSEVFSESEVDRSLAQIEIEGENKQPEKKYEKSGLSPQLAEKYLEKLKNLMQEKKPYTDSDLTLGRLAEMLNISQHNLSEVINSGLNQNFFDFINSYRVEAAKEKLLDGTTQNFTVLAIAFDAGFNSKSAFNTIFKKHTGQTPSEFRKQNAG